ncbi:hypothetical protein K439DRAFT_1660769 [Ramaria rubella]|nr:hypothetical protein K439DRAFT_1660769 [Ramaria rubella]
MTQLSSYIPDSSLGSPKGVAQQWVEETKEKWENGLDWREQEQKINEFPQWNTVIEDDDAANYSIYFVGSVSEKKDAIPMVLLHGWPVLAFDPLSGLICVARVSSHCTYALWLRFSSPPQLEKDLVVYAWFISSRRSGLRGRLCRARSDIESLTARMLGCKMLASIFRSVVVVASDPGPIALLTR